MLRFGIPYGPRARPAAVVPAMIVARAGGRAADDRRRRPADAALRLRRGSRGWRRPRPGRRRRQPHLQPRLHRGRHDQTRRRDASAGRRRRGDRVHARSLRRLRRRGDQRRPSARELGWSASHPSRRACAGTSTSVRDSPSPSPSPRPWLTPRWADRATACAPLALWASLSPAWQRPARSTRSSTRRRWRRWRWRSPLPVALVRTLDWSPRLGRGSRAGSGSLAALLLALVVPAPGTGALPIISIVLLLLVASTATGRPGRRQLRAGWRERYSETRRARAARAAAA